MFIEKLKLKNYRNYEEINIEFDPNINIIYGNNAEGKTNILESIYICSTSKSYRNSKEKEIIKFDKNEAHIKIILYKENLSKKENAIDIQLNKEIKKGIALNGVKIEKLSEFLGFFTVVIFSPEDLNIIKEGPKVRRKFLDMELCQIDKIYVTYISNYNKILSERNTLLKDIKESKGSNKEELKNLIITYDEELIKYGIEIIKKRKENIEELNTKIKDLYYKISGNKEFLHIEYENDVLQILGASYASPEKIKQIYTELLNKNIDNDIKNGFTSVGPHLDDICFYVEDVDLRKYGSQGQKKTAAISLKLSELMIVREKIKETPVLLLDDVFSELDETRQKNLIENIEGIQTIITCTGMKKNIFDLLKPNKIFKVSNNEIISQNM